MTNPANSRFVEIGRIGRPRGLDGTARFTPDPLFTVDLFENPVLFYLKNSRGDLVPARLNSYQVENKRNQQTFFVKFDVIANRNDAEAAMNKALYVDKDEPGLAVSSSESIEESITGYSVWFRKKEIGHVLDLLENPAHPILEIKYGAESLLIPYVDEFVDRVDHKKGSVFCKNLDQLTDL